MDRRETLKVFIQEINRLEDKNLALMESSIQGLPTLVTSDEALLLMRIRKDIISQITDIEKAISKISITEMPTAENQARLLRYYKIRTIFLSASEVATQRIDNYYLN